MRFCSLSASSRTCSQLRCGPPNRYAMRTKTLQYTHRRIRLDDSSPLPTPTDSRLSCPRTPRGSAGGWKTLSSAREYVPRWVPKGIVASRNPPGVRKTLTTMSLSSPSLGFSTHSASVPSTEAATKERPTAQPRGKRVVSSKKSARAALERRSAIGGLGAVASLRGGRDCRRRCDPMRCCRRRWSRCNRYSGRRDCCTGPGRPVWWSQSKKCNGNLHLL